MDPAGWVLRVASCCLSIATNVALPLSLLLLVFGTRHLIISTLQAWIAKGRKQKNRAALQDNYGPMKQELHVEDLAVKGKVPKELNGAYMRNGPNPYLDPVASYHWFEGSGMVHAVRIKDGNMSYGNRYVETNRLKQEREAGKHIYAAFADQGGKRGIWVALLEMLKIKLRAVDTKEGTGTANTALMYHAGRLLALHEGDLPYQLRMICNGVVETVQRLKIGNDWGETCFTAHPKFYSPTGELHFLGYDITKPEVKLGTLDAAGQLQHTMKVDLPWPVMMHDKAITDKYKVVLHCPICFEPKAMVERESLPIVWVPERPTRIGLVPKTTKSQADIKWFELPSFMSFHVANAWEEGDGRYVKIVLCTMKRIDMKAIEIMEFAEDMVSRLSEITLDTAAPGLEGASMRQISSVTGDFPICHPLLQGQKTRYAWTAMTDIHDRQAKSIGIAKHDLDSKAADVCVAKVLYEPGCYGGEAFFVPRNANDPSKPCQEDDGFLLVYIYKAAEDTSYFVVFDAKTMSSTPICEVRIPQRIPYGFHTTFLNEQQLKASNTPESRAVKA